ncbi:hypothetical protein Tcan_06974 [Toxocara canis]|uniref:Uncharacterized protein n=1 Tax=Toxocara canis TaxID=6265 RepID=A0A0B2VZ66_TOXCA|nr:hypothetical protein Tcan_06974 [Toxocara canis]
MSVGLFIVHIILYQICCSLVHAQCPSDSVWVAHDCNSSSQCTPYTSVAVRCVDGECCTLPGATKCENGGTAVALFCTVSEECLPYTPDPVACLSRTCCTVPSRCPNGGDVIGLGCSVTSDCTTAANGTAAVCIDGLCCTIAVNYSADYRVLPTSRSSP